MSEFWSWLGYSLALGVGATLICDFWGQLVRLVTGIPPLDWRLVGRWIGHMPREFAHDNIRSAAPIRGEKALGWTVHYLTGVFFAAVFLGIFGIEWVANPRVLEAVGFGVATVVLPFFVMQPALGAGTAARRTPHPLRARFLSVMTHSVFGLGIWFSAAIANVLR